MKYDVVDLGTKKGGALDVFREAGPRYFLAAGGVSVGGCLGVDANEAYAADVRRKGYRFETLRFPDDLGALPEASYYLAFDFLEHLNGVDESDRVLEVMLAKASRGVWLRMPSFEQDTLTGEGVLRKHGLRFAWTHWVGHKSPYRLEHALRVISGCGRFHRYDLRGNRKIAVSSDRAVVPVEAPIDTVNYSKALGPKPAIEFKPPVIGQWEVLIHFQ